MQSIAPWISGIAATFFAVDSALMVAEGAVKKIAPVSIEGLGIGPEIINPGKSFLVDWVITKRTACPGETSRVWIGEDGFFLAEASRPTRLPSTPDAQEYKIQTRAPELAPPGQIQLFISGWYQCPGSDRNGFELGPVVMTVVEPDTENKGR